MLKEYQRLLEGTVASVAEAEPQINGEEAGSARFKKSELAWVAGRFTNLLTFAELTPGTLLNPVKLTLEGVAAPAAHSRVWAGAMIINGKNELVTVWRANA